MYKKFVFLSCVCAFWTEAARPNEESLRVLVQDPSVGVQEIKLFRDLNPTLLVKRQDELVEGSMKNLEEKSGVDDKQKEKIMNDYLERLRNVGEIGYTEIRSRNFDLYPKKPAREVEGPKSYHENPGEVPTKVNYPGRGQWARKGTKHKPHVTNHKHLYPDVYDEEREGYFNDLKKYADSNADTTDHEKEPQEFLPYRSYSQVRRSEIEKTIPKKQKNQKDKRLKEIQKHSKAHTVYTEEGYEDSAYDHGGTKKKGDKLEKDRRTREEGEEIFPDVPQYEVNEEKESENEEILKQDRFEPEKKEREEEEGELRRSRRDEATRRVNPKFRRNRVPTGRNAEETRNLKPKNKHRIEEKIEGDPSKYFTFEHEDWFQKYRFDNIGDFFALPPDEIQTKQPKIDKEEEIKTDKNDETTTDRSKEIKAVEKVEVIPEKKEELKLEKKEKNPLLSTPKSDIEIKRIIPPIKSKKTEETARRRNSARSFGQGNEAVTRRFDDNLTNETKNAKLYMIIIENKNDSPEKANLTQTENEEEAHGDTSEENSELEEVEEEENDEEGEGDAKKYYEIGANEKEESREGVKGRRYLPVIILNPQEIHVQQITEENSKRPFEGDNNKNINKQPYKELEIKNIEDIKNPTFDRNGQKVTKKSSEEGVGRNNDRKEYNKPTEDKKENYNELKIKSPNVESNQKFGQALLENVQIKYPRLENDDEETEKQNHGTREKEESDQNERQIEDTVINKTEDQNLPPGLVNTEEEAYLSSPKPINKNYLKKPTRTKTVQNRNLERLVFPLFFGYNREAYPEETTQAPKIEENPQEDRYEEEEQVNEGSYEPKSPQQQNLYPIIVENVQESSKNQPKNQDDINEQKIPEGAEEKNSTPTQYENEENGRPKNEAPLKITSQERTTEPKSREEKILIIPIIKEDENNDSNITHPIVAEESYEENREKNREETRNGNEQENRQNSDASRTENGEENRRSKNNDDAKKFHDEENPSNPNSATLPNEKRKKMKKGEHKVETKPRGSKKFKPVDAVQKKNHEEAEENYPRLFLENREKWKQSYDKNRNGTVKSYPLTLPEISEDNRNKEQLNDEKINSKSTEEITSPTTKNREKIVENGEEDENAKILKAKNSENEEIEVEPYEEKKDRNDEQFITYPITIEEIKQVNFSDTKHLNTDELKRDNENIINKSLQRKNNSEGVILPAKVEEITQNDRFNTSEVNDRYEDLKTSPANDRKLKRTYQDTNNEQSRNTQSKTNERTKEKRRPRNQWNINWEDERNFPLNNDVSTHEDKDNLKKSVRDRHLKNDGKLLRKTNQDALSVKLRTKPGEETKYSEYPQENIPKDSEAASKKDFEENFREGFGENSRATFGEHPIGFPTKYTKEVSMEMPEEDSRGVLEEDPEENSKEASREDSKEEESVEETDQERRKPEEGMGNTKIGSQSKSEGGNRPQKNYPKERNGEVSKKTEKGRNDKDSQREISYPPKLPEAHPLVQKRSNVGEMSRKMNIPNVAKAETEDDIVGTVIGEERFGKRIRKRRSVEVEPKGQLDQEKYPNYHSKELEKTSSFRYAENPKNILVKKKNEMVLYDKVEEVDCPETRDIDPLPEKVENPKNETNNSNRTDYDPKTRIKGKLSTQIDCLKKRYFGDNPLDNPLFEEDYDETVPSSVLQESRAGKAIEGILEQPKAEPYVMRIRIVRRRPQNPVIRGSIRRRRPERYEERPKEDPNKFFSEVHYKEEIKPSEQLNVFADVINNIKSSNGDTETSGSKNEEVYIGKKPNAYRKFRVTTSKPFLPTPIPTERRKRLPVRILPEHKNAEEIIIIKKPPRLHQPKLKEETENDHVESEESLIKNVEEKPTNKFYYIGLRPPPKEPYKHPNFYNPDIEQRKISSGKRRRIKRSRGYAEIKRARNETVDDVDDYVPHRERNFHYDEKTGKIVYDKKTEETVEYDYVDVEEPTHPPPKKKVEPKRFPPTPPPGPNYLDYIKMLKSHPSYSVIEDPKPMEKEEMTENAVASSESSSPSTGLPEFLSILNKVKSDKSYKIYLDPVPESKGGKKEEISRREREDEEEEETDEKESVQNSPGVQGFLSGEPSMPAFDSSELVPQAKSYSPKTSIDTSRYTNIRRSRVKNQEVEEETNIFTTTPQSQTIEIPTSSLKPTTPTEEPSEVTKKGRTLRRRPSISQEVTTEVTSTKITQRRQRGRARYRSTTPSTVKKENLRSRRNLQRRSYEIPRNHRRHYAKTRNDIEAFKPTPRTITLKLINQTDISRLVNGSKSEKKNPEDVEVFGKFDGGKKHGGNYKYKKVQIKITRNYEPGKEEERKMKIEPKFYDGPSLAERINTLKEKNNYELTETFIQEENTPGDEEEFDEEITRRLDVTTKKVPNIIKDPSKRLYFYAPI